MAARDRGSEALASGVYEDLVTERVARALEAVGLEKVVSDLDDADAHVVLARHLGREIERALATLPRAKRAEQAMALTTTLLEKLAVVVSDGEAVREERLVPPPRQLLALHRGSMPERPGSPMGSSTLLTRNRAEPALGHELAREIAIADRIDAIIAFVTVGGVRAIRDALHRFARRPGARFRLLTTTFTGTTEARALDELARLPGAEIRVSYDTRRTRLHAKAWLFHRDSGLTTAYIGSANLTSTALGSGQEWMVKVARDLPHVIDKFRGTFETLWADGEFEPYHPHEPSHRERLDAALAGGASAPQDAVLFSIRAFPFQEGILDQLAAEREIHGRRRNLVVAATGTGKTVICALDYQRQQWRHGVAPRLLFLAHREELLEQARHTFRCVLQDPSFGELLTGRATPRRYDHVFATIQSARSTRLVERLGPDHFRHVVVDECHHIPARSYQDVVAQLTPDLLVGLTATPERTDRKSLLSDFDGHIGAELRLWQALDDQLLVPFEYYGIADDVDLRRVRWSRRGYDTAGLDAVYTGNDARASLIHGQLVRRVRDPRDVRALGFCVSVAHAEYMAERFTARGTPALALHGDSPAELRADAPRRLRAREVNVIFTCDLYNEGVDLPFVDTLLLLRPTESATVFLQQLGRGLRHFSGPPPKTSCLVLDFVGQHRQEFRFDACLSAMTGIPRARLRRDVEEDFPYLPSGCVLQLDEVARDTVLRSLQSQLATAARLAQELRDLVGPAGRPRLASFLSQTKRDVDEIYAAGGWTTLQRRAGLIEPAHDPAADDFSRRLGWLRHIDEPGRLGTYREAMDAALQGTSPSLSAHDRTRLHMLDFQLHPRGVLRAAEETIAYFGHSSAIAAELDELCEVLADRIALAGDTRPVPAWPLALHRHYQRREIVAAVGFVHPGKKGVTPQSGVLKLDGNRELLFVTLDKSGRSFSPSTRYRDYAISRDRFHWETQAAASVTRPSGRRYLESPDNGWSFYLFVRTRPGAPYAFLGPVRYESHIGDRPIAITWRLEHSLPAALYERYATLRPG